MIYIWADEVKNELYFSFDNVMHDEGKKLNLISNFNFCREREIVYMCSYVENWADNVDNLSCKWDVDSYPLKSLKLLGRN